MPRLPDFLVIGAAKSGTTTLYHWLREHPGVFLPDFKEPYFFSSYKPSRQSVRELEEYERLCRAGGVRFFAATREDALKKSTLVLNFGWPCLPECLLVSWSLFVSATLSSFL